MYNDKKIIAIIPARKGSKRIREKNLRMLCGKPLFCYSIDTAKKSKYIDDVLVSSDSNEINQIARKKFCITNGIRPKLLSDDKARIVDVILYELEKINKKYDAIVLLQPTFPIRTAELLDLAIEKYFQNEESLITVVKVKEHPVFMRRNIKDKLSKIIEDSSDIRSQDFENIYRIVGNIYINNISKLSSNTILNENTYPFELSGKYTIDIDNEEDFKETEKILKEGKI